MMSLDAAVQNLGVALESASLGQALIDSGKLQPIFGDNMSLEVQAHFMVYPSQHASRPEVKSFVEWLRLAAAPSTP
jgi:LysR family glycine cleavage system transcriptional activator